GWQVEALIARIRQHPELGRRLFWLNYISDAYLEKVYAASACLIAASEGEGFGLPLIEAARHRLPIIARGIPVFKEVAGEHALYFDGLRPADLAAAIEHWLALAGRGAAPPATGMQWLTWTESIGQLKQKLLGYPLRDTWYDAEQPDVSLIVLNYNKPAMTLACIESLWRQTQGYRYEIVLVDNGSTPENVMALAPAEAGARIVRTGVNRYFGEGNNLGCEAARGRYVVFLNNDIIATPGWLEPLIRRLENDPGIGATGPQLVSPDGRLQEAGAEIGATGDEQRYGRDADPFDPAYAVERDVMYASAAALAMRKDTFERVLGFDLYYEPAYYEDCDLCLKIRQLGLKVLYCPDARIIHIENATSMDQMGDKFKLKELVMLNRGRFLARWQPVLEGKVTGIEGLLPPPAPPLCVRQGLPAVL
ncbi:MAG: glycosyltransferase, partial [Bacillota bacterium]|nr:glycosyltransferase [Bacillota bacterium]